MEDGYGTNNDLSKYRITFNKLFKRPIYVIGDRMLSTSDEVMIYKEDDKVFVGRLEHCCVSVVNI